VYKLKYNTTSIRDCPFGFSLTFIFINASIIMVVSCIDGGNWNTLQKPPASQKSPTKFIQRNG
jgi:hypothetical protein